MHIITREGKGRLGPPEAQHRTSLSPVDTAHGPDYHELGSSVMRVPAIYVDGLRSRSPAI